MGRNSRRTGNRRRLVFRILTGCNTLLICLLLAGSGLLLLAAGDGSALFGCRTLLEAPSRSGGAGDSDRLILYREERPQAGDTILIREDAETVFLAVVDRVDGDAISFTTPAGRSDTLLETQEEYQGRVLWESGLLGHCLAVIAAPENLVVTYTVIAAAFFVCALFCVWLHLRAGRQHRHTIRQLTDRMPVAALPAAAGEEVQLSGPFQAGSAMARHGKGTADPGEDPSLTSALPGLAAIRFGTGRAAGLIRSWTAGPTASKKFRTQRPAPAAETAPAHTQRPAPAAETAPAHTQRPAPAAETAPVHTQRPAPAAEIDSPLSAEPNSGAGAPEPRTEESEIYDLYDLPSAVRIEDLLREIEEQFRAGLEDK